MSAAQQMTNIERMPAARAASSPAWLSSKTRQSAGATPSARGALQVPVGVGLRRAHGVAADARARIDAVGDAELAEEGVDHGARARGDDPEREPQRGLTDRLGRARHGRDVRGDSRPVGEQLVGERSRAARHAGAGAHHVPRRTPRCGRASPSAAGRSPGTPWRSAITRIAVSVWIFAVDQRAVEVEERGAHGRSCGNPQARERQRPGHPGLAGRIDDAERERRRRAPPVDVDLAEVGVGDDFARAVRIRRRHAPFLGEAARGEVPQRIGHVDVALRQFRVMDVAARGRGRRSRASGGSRRTGGPGRARSSPRPPSR